MTARKAIEIIYFIAVALFMLVAIAYDIAAGSPCWMLFHILVLALNLGFVIQNVQRLRP